MMHRLFAPFAAYLHGVIRLSIAAATVVMSFFELAGNGWSEYDGILRVANAQSFLGGSSQCKSREAEAFRYWPSLASTGSP
jgi:hypothetical protein